jgi:hypothetical protein
MRLEYRRKQWTEEQNTNGRHENCGMSEKDERNT